MWSQNVSFALVILGMWMGACMFQLPPSQVHCTDPAPLGSWKDSQAKGMPWFVPFHHCSKSCQN